MYDEPVRTNFGLRIIQLLDLPTVDFYRLTENYCCER